MNNIKNNLISLALQVGRVVLKIYNTGFDVSYKKDESPLTKADIIANEIIVVGLKKYFPNYGILAEKSQDDLYRLDRK